MYDARIIKGELVNATLINDNALAPIIVYKNAVAAGAESVSLGKISGVQGRVVEALIIAHDGSTTPTVTIKNGSTAITNAMTKSGTIKTITRAGTIDYDVTLADGDELFATFSGAGNVDVVLILALTSIPA